MEKIVRNLAQSVDKMADKIGKLEKSMKKQFNSKTPKALKNFIRDPGLLFDNYNRKIPKSDVLKFLENKKEGVAFSEMLELIVKLKINNIFEKRQEEKKAAARSKTAKRSRKTTKKKTAKKKTASKKKTTRSL
jgi:hypothetical protein